MRVTRFGSYRFFLLASVAAAAVSSHAGAASYNNTSPATASGPSYTLHSGDSLSNSSSVTSTGASQAAVLVGSGASSITNSGLIQGTGANGLGIQVVSGGSVGSITNSGTVQSTSGGTAILAGDTVGPGASIDTLTNSGVIAASGSGSAVQVEAGSTIGAIVNSGSILATGSGDGINTLGTIGSILNSGQILSTSGTAIAVASTGSITGGITNAAGGTISATGTNSVAIDAAGTIGSIVNSGLIQGSTVGGGYGPGAIRIEGTTGAIGSIANNAGGTIASSSYSAIDVAGRLGALTNNGFIGATAGSENDAVYIENRGSVGSISNGASGTIQANTAVGWAVEVNGSVGALSNAGLIQANGTTGIGIQVDGGTVGTASNTGLIQANGTRGIGINVGDSAGSSIGSLINSGTIMAQQGTGIAVVSLGTIPGGITNTASGLIQGGPSNGSGVAIDDSAGSNKLTINTAGTIIGAIKLGAAGDTLNVTGGAITGAIIGQAGSGDLLNFSPTGTFATGGSIANVDTIAVTSGTVAVQQPLTGALAFDISPAAAAILNSGVGATSFYNAGLVSVGSGHQTITGNYTQASSGALGVTVIPGSSGALTVTGTATLQGTHPVVDVHVPTSTNDFAFTQSQTYAVLSASTIVATGTPTAVSDNSGISFGATDSGTQLLLSPLAMTNGQINAAAANDITTIFAPLAGIETPSQRQAQLFLQQVFVGLAETGHVQLLNTLDTILTNLTPTQVLQFNNQLLPSTIQDANLNLLTTTNVLSGSFNTILSRLFTARLESQQSGLAAGDEVGRGITVWGQPFGALTNQSAQNGVEGFDIATYGITFGGDMLVMPNVRAGVAVSLSNSDVTYNGTLSGNKGSVFTGQLALYGTWYLQNFFVDGLLSFGYNHYSRTNHLSALGVTLDADSGGTAFSAKLGAGYDFKLGNGAILTPYGSVQQFHLNFGSYTTSGGSVYDVDMHVNSASTDLTQSRFGARLAYPVKLQSGGILTPDIHLYWLHDFGSNQLTLTYTTADLVGPNTFFSVGPHADRDTINVGIGVTLAKGAGWSFGGGYDYAGRSSLSGHNFYVNVKFEF